MGALKAQLQAHIDGAAESIITAGNALLEVSKRMESDKFKHWILVEFEMPYSMALSYMAVAVANQHSKDALSPTEILERFMSLIARKDVQSKPVQLTLADAQ